MNLARGASRPERIFFQTTRPVNWDVYELTGPGKPPRRLTDDPGLNYDPAPSPDGRWLVFTSERRGNPDLFVLDLRSGGAPRLLIDSEAMEDQATISADGETLVFVSSREGNSEIFSLPFKPERTQTMERAVNLSRHSGSDLRPAFSPDGKAIAFSSDRGVAATRRFSNFPFSRLRPTDIYIMNVDGSGQRRLTDSPGWDGSPIFSPDGSTIFFYSDRSETSNGKRSNYRIWSMGTDGRNVHPISPPTIQALSPAVTQKGRIVFAASAELGTNYSNRVFKSRIVSVNADGTDYREESDPAQELRGPVVGPDGRIFCYGPGPEMLTAVPPAGTDRILVHRSPTQVAIADRHVALYADHDGAQPHPRRDEFLQVQEDEITQKERLLVYDISRNASRELLKAPPASGGILDWKYSRDGKWITFMVGPFFGDASQRSDIWVAQSDGSHLTNLTANVSGNNGFPDFSGDGRRIVFRSYRTGNSDIFLMNSDGSGVRQLTDHPGRDTFPAFCPTRNEIAFVSDRDGELDETGSYRSMDIYTLQLRPDGAPGELRRITDDPGHDSHVQYSPDGEWLVFTSERAGQGDEWPLIPASPQSYGEIFALRLADKFLVRLTHNKWEEGTSSWVGPVE